MILRNTLGWLYKERKQVYLWWVNTFFALFSFGLIVKLLTKGSSNLTFRWTSKSTKFIHRMCTSFEHWSVGKDKF
jgi:hypothetical protein